MGAPRVDVVRHPAGAAALSDVPAARPAAADMAPAQRFTRAVAASGTATFVALVSHLLAGGAAPGAAGVLVPWLLAMPVCLVVAPVRLPWLRLTASVGVSQLLFHTLFSVGAAVGAGAPAAGAHQHGHAAAWVPDAGAPVAHAGHGSGAMVFAHVVAAVVTVVALRHGEEALHRVAAALRRAVRAVVRVRVPLLPVRPHVPSAPLGDERAWRPLARVAIGASVVRRGPPVAGISPTS